MSIGVRVCVPKVPSYNTDGDIQIRPLSDHIGFGVYRYMVKRLVFLPLHGEEASFPSRKSCGGRRQSFAPRISRSKIGCLRDRLPTVATALIRTR